MESNIYILLELEPTVKDVSAIVAAANKKKTEWNGYVNHPKKKLQVKEMVSAFNDVIAKVTQNPQMLDDHAKEYVIIRQKARLEQEKAIREQASMLVVNGEIDEVSLDSLLKTYNQYKKDEILTILGVRIKQKKSFKYVDDGIKELEKSTFDGIMSNLQVLNHKDLYDFLAMPPTSSIAKIEEKRQFIYTENNKNSNKDAKNTATGLLCGSVKDVLCNEGNRKRYHKSLENIVFRDIYSMIDMATQSNKIITSEQYKKLLDECAKKRIDGDKAEYYIYKYCTEVKKGISIIEPSDSDFVSRLTCRICSTPNSPQASVCKSCAFPLVVTCPDCGRKSADYKELKCVQCGFSIGDMPYAETELLQAEKSLAVGDMSAAEKHLAQAEAYWNTYPAISAFKSKLNREQSIIDSSIKKIDDLKKKKEYMTLLSSIKNTKISSAVLNVYKTEAENAINNAKAVWEKAGTLNNPIAKIEICMQVLSICADFEEAKKDLILNPPQSPPNFKAIMVGKTARLNWDKLPSGYLRYAIVRKINGMPQNQSDGTLIADLSDNGYDDTDISAGLSYYYTVYSKCSDIYSKNRAVAGPLMAIEEINLSALKYDVQEKHINFTCKFPPNAKCVDVYRDGSLIKTLVTENFVDSGLVPGKPYNYGFIAVFEDCLGTKHHSKSVDIQLKPQIPPKPVTSLKFRKEAGNIILSWDAGDVNTNNIRLLQTDVQLGKPAGALVSMKEIEQSGKLLTATLPNQAILTLNNSQVKNYFSIWTICGSNLMFGSEVEIINIQEVSDLKAYISSGKLYVEWTWPEHCIQTKVSYSNKSFDDAYKIVKTCPKAVYDKKRAFVIESVFDCDYYIEVQIQKFDGNREILSSGSRTTVKNSNPMTIRYTLKVSTFLKKKLTLTIDNDNNAYLPELVLVTTPGRMPARKEDGMVIHVVPEGTACGTFELLSGHIRKNYYARLFLSDTSIRNIRIITPNSEQLKVY